jgi:hypothetical protein
LQPSLLLRIEGLDWPTFSGDREVASDAAAEAFAQAIGRETHFATLNVGSGGAAFRIAAGELKDRVSFALVPLSAARKGCLVIEPITVGEKRLQVRNGV